MGLEYNKDEFLSWLLKVRKRLFVVFLNDAHDSERNESKCYKYLRMDKKLKKRYAPFKELANMENSIVTQDEFREGFIKEFFKLTSEGLQAYIGIHSNSRAHAK